MIRVALLVAAVAVSLMLWPQVMAAGTFSGQALLCIVLWALFLLTLWWSPDGAA